MNIDSERWLRLFLRVVGGTCLLALVAVVMPASWLAAIHERTGLPGSYSAAPITDYLARSTSIMWAFTGGLFLLAAGDVRGRRALIVYLAAALFVIGTVLVVVDIVGAFPWWWVVGEFLCAIPIGVIVLVLLRGVPSNDCGKEGHA